MKKLLFFALLLVSAPWARAQSTSNGTITSTQCVTIGVEASSTVGIAVTGTWTGTLQPKIEIQGQTPANIQVTPSTSSTAQSTITADGVFRATVAGGSTFMVCGATVATGSASIWLNSTKASASGFTGSGGGSGTVTNVATTSPVTGGPITTTGTIACATCVTSTTPGAGLAHFAGGTQDVTSSAVNLASGDVTGLLPGANGGITTSSTAGQGFMVSDGVVNLESTSSANAVFVTANNQVRFRQFVSPIRLTITSIKIDITTNAASSDCAVAIYDAAGTTRLTQSGAISTATTGVKTATIAAFTFAQGTAYYIAESCTDATVAGPIITSSTQTAIRDLANSTQIRVGTSANAYATPNMPASLAPSTATGGIVNFPYIFLEP